MCVLTITIFECSTVHQAYIRFSSHAQLTCPPFFKNVDFPNYKNWNLEMCLGAVSACLKKQMRGTSTVITFNLKTIFRSMRLLLRIDSARPPDRPPARPTARPDSGRFPSGFRPDSGRILAGFRPVSGRIPAGFRPDSGWIPAGFRPDPGRNPVLFFFCLGGY